MRGLVSGATGLLQTRLALLGTELREELARWTLVVLGGCGAVALAALGLAAGSAALVLGVEPQHRAMAAAALALLFVCGGTYLAWRIYAVLAVKPAAFSASLTELEKDRLALVETSRAQRSALGEGLGQIGRLVSVGVLAYSIARRLRRSGDQR